MDYSTQLQIQLTAQYAVTDTETVRAREQYRYRIAYGIALAKKSEAEQTPTSTQAVNFCIECVNKDAFFCFGKNAIVVRVIHTSFGALVVVVILGRCCRQVFFW